MSRGFFLFPDRLLRSGRPERLSVAEKSAAHRVQGHGDRQRVLLRLRGRNDVVLGRQIQMDDEHCHIHRRSGGERNNNLFVKRLSAVRRSCFRFPFREERAIIISGGNNNRKQ